MNKIKWIFFDIGGVLLDDSRAEALKRQVLWDIIKKYLPKVTLAKIENLFTRLSSEHGIISYNILKFLLTNSNDLEQAEETRRAKWPEIGYYRHSTIRPEAKKVLTKLSKKYHLGVIANQNILAKEKLKEAGIYDLLHHQTVSDEHGLEKPDPKYFQAVFKETGANPNESVIVDDNIERALIPGKKLGMTTVWYKLQERTDIPKNQVNFTITSLADLLDYCPLRCHSRENGNSELEQYLDPRS